MTVNLDEVEFTNDFFSFLTPDGSTVTLNKIDEDLKLNGYTDSVKIQSINIELLTIEEKFIMCPSVIGMKNDFLQISTEHKEYEGAVLTSDNMKYCTIEIYE